MNRAFLRLSYPQQSAGGVDGGFGQQLAGQVKVYFGLNSRQGDCGSDWGEDILVSSPGSQLLHHLPVVLVKVEGAAGCPWFYRCTHHSVKRYHRETKGFDQCDSVVEKLNLPTDVGLIIIFLMNKD